jgi:hypothetical protein
MKRPKCMEARDRRLAAIHEAGHKVVAHHLGVPTRGAKIWRRGAPSLRGRSWGGQIGIAAAPAAKRRCAAVAGAIAEAAWTGDDEPDFYDPGTMSLTDWKQAGVEPGDGDALLDAADAVFALLRRGGPLWSALLREARQLMLDGRDA